MGSGGIQIGTLKASVADKDFVVRAWASLILGERIITRAARDQQLNLRTRGNLRDLVE